MKAVRIIDENYINFIRHCFKRQGFSLKDDIVYVSMHDYKILKKLFNQTGIKYENCNSRN